MDRGNTPRWACWVDKLFSWPYLPADWYTRRANRRQERSSVEALKSLGKAFALFVPTVWLIYHNGYNLFLNVTSKGVDVSEIRPYPPAPYHAPPENFLQVALQIGLFAYLITALWWVFFPRSCPGIAKGYCVLVLVIVIWFWLFIGLRHVGSWL